MAGPKSASGPSTRNDGGGASDLAVLTARAKSNPSGPTGNVTGRAPRPGRERLSREGLRQTRGGWLGRSNSRRLHPGIADRSRRNEQRLAGETKRRTV